MKGAEKREEDTGKNEEGKRKERGNYGIATLDEHSGGLLGEPMLSLQRERFREQKAPEGCLKQAQVSLQR